MKIWKATQEGPSMHAMTCDVEDYFQVSAFSNHIRRDDWEQLECRIPRNVDRILGQLEKHSAKATFFTLGWVAEHYPQVVRQIAAAGHEIASHGMEHTRVWQQTADQFKADATHTRALLEDVSGHRVSGYRAASWSIDGRTPWAHDVLAEAGYTYSSSIYPIAHDTFGVPDAPVGPHYVGDSGILEIPPSVSRVLGRNIPAAGGGYFRLFPLPVSIWLMNRVESSGERPFVFYFHPWEVDPDQPRVAGVPAKARLRHYLNLKRFESRFESILQRYDWGRMDAIYLGDESS